MTMKDLVGQVFNKLTVIKRVGSNSRGERLWLCQCDCGRTKEVKTTNLIKGKTKSCGCLLPGPAMDDSIIGKTFGDLRIEKYFVEWCKLIAQEN